MTNMVMVGLLIVHIVLAISSAIEKRWPLCLYWVGAAILTTGVLWMGTRATEVSK